MKPVATNQGKNVLLGGSIFATANSPYNAELLAIMLNNYDDLSVAVVIAAYEMQKPEPDLSVVKSVLNKVLAQALQP